MPKVNYTKRKIYQPALLQIIIATLRLDLEFNLGWVLASPSLTSWATMIIQGLPTTNPPTQPTTLPTLWGYLNRVSEVTVRCLAVVQRIFRGWYCFGKVCTGHMKGSGTWSLQAGDTIWRYSRQSTSQTFTLHWKPKFCYLITQNNMIQNVWGHLSRENWSWQHF